MNEIKGFTTAEFRWLSNFYKLQYPLEFDGHLFYYTENLYQAFKSRNDYDFVKFADITPAEAKKLGQTVELIEEWDYGKMLKFEAMKFVTDLKYDQPYFKEKLLATGDCYIEETNWWHDNTYGNCSCDKCKDIIGLNHLGLIIMEKRERLKKEL